MQKGFERIEAHNVFTDTRFSTGCIGPNPPDRLQGSATCANNIGICSTRDDFADDKSGRIHKYAGCALGDGFRPR